MMTELAVGWPGLGPVVGLDRGAILMEISAGGPAPIRLTAVTENSNSCPIFAPDGMGIGKLVSSLLRYSF